MPQIELLGLASRYAGRSHLHSNGATLEEVLRDISQQCPEFAARTVPPHLLPSGLIVCVNERRFTSDLTERVQPTDRILILSADVGG